MMDLFADDEVEDYELKNNNDPNQFLKYESDPIPLDGSRNSMDITSIEALEELAELNPNLILPHLLPLNEKLSPPRGTTHDIFNKEGIQLMHVQMPNTLPAIDRELEIGESENKTDKKVYEPSKLEFLPSGQLGKLRIHKSGKIMLHIDGHEFNFLRGNGSTCNQQVACHLEQNNEFLFLGNLHNRFVVSPNLSCLGANQHT
ncbi:uncharacterized protein TA11445 [Theileria annulata]|uniref:RNA polymerase III RPC4 n=1 Tax=Theileria annulata TaxID=5874 RepID=Q4UDH8_THEAN|nr:uncharacterized protein TA11445 [Theileria annulata]CAI74861.1 hypothetical protein TA11445 [Theileria annulata]|eukprot:XP_952593.1 hypothetical protein TA11445 [Theileria annulata]